MKQGLAIALAMALMTPAHSAVLFSGVAVSDGFEAIIPELDLGTVVSGQTRTFRFDYSSDDPVIGRGGGGPKLELFGHGDYYFYTPGSPLGPIDVNDIRIHDICDVVIPGGGCFGGVGEGIKLLLVEPGRVDFSMTGYVGFDNCVPTGGPAGQVCANIYPTPFGLRISAPLLETSSDVTYSVSEIPEPSTWLSLIAGFGMVGVALRKRQNRSQSGLATLARQSAVKQG